MYKDIITISTVAFHAEWGDKERNLNRILGYMEAAAKKGSDLLLLPEMALAWLLRQPEITSVLIGASKPSQIIANIKALDNIDFTDEELKEINLV